MAWWHGIAVQHPGGSTQPFLDGLEQSFVVSWTFSNSRRTDFFLLDLGKGLGSKSKDGWEAKRRLGS